MRGREKMTKVKKLWWREATVVNEAMVGGIESGDNSDEHRFD